MSKPSRPRFSGEPVNFTYSSNVMPRANRSGVMAIGLSRGAPAVPGRLRALGEWWPFRGPHLDQSVELAGVLADDLALDGRADAGEVLGDPLLRVGPDAVGVRIVRAPHDVVLADQRDHRRDGRLVLVRRVPLPAPQLARLHRQ